MHNYSHSKNWKGPRTVFMWPSSTSLTTIGSENYISTDASTFLQVSHDKFLLIK